VTILVISPEGQVVGHTVGDHVVATTEEFEGVLRGFAEGGAPWMIGGSDDEVCWDGFEPVFPGDPRYPDALVRGLLSGGYRFREGSLEEPSPLSSPTTPQEFP